MSLTRFWLGTCHQGFKNLPYPYAILQARTWLYAIFSKRDTQPYTLYKNLENRYHSLYESRENWCNSQWHVSCTARLVSFMFQHFRCSLKFIDNGKIREVNLEMVDHVNGPRFQMLVHWTVENRSDTKSINLVYPIEQCLSKLKWLLSIKKTRWQDSKQSCINKQLLPLSLYIYTYRLWSKNARFPRC